MYIGHCTISSLTCGCKYLTHVIVKYVGAINFIQQMQGTFHYFVKKIKNASVAESSHITIVSYNSMFDIGFIFENGLSILFNDLVKRTFNFYRMILVIVPTSLFQVTKVFRYTKNLIANIIPSHFF